ncbi:MAG: hypothetical protein ABW007_02835 [Chitinophagaceae bacterium]
MRKFFPALALGFILLTSFVSDKPETDTESTVSAGVTGCHITVVSITRYVCGDVYEGSASFYDPESNCGVQTFYEVTPGQDNGICTHDHSAPPDGLK